MLQIETLLGGFDENLAYLAWGADPEDGFLVDASLSAPQLLQAGAGRCSWMLLTHTHMDHLIGLPGLLQELPELRVAGWEGLSPERYGLAGERFDPLAHGAERVYAGASCRVLHTPGHSPDGVCFYFPQDGILFTGDTVFVGRTGRTRGGNSDTRVLYRSLRDHILPLPDETIIYPGHDYGPTQSSTIGEQRESNRFFQAADEDDFVRIMAEYEASRG